MADTSASLLDLWTALGVMTGVTHSAHIYASVSALHVLGIALLVGPILLVDLRWLGRLPGLDGTAVAILRRTARVGLGLVLTTGVLLTSARPFEYFENRVFLAKLAVITLGIANALVFAWLDRRHNGSERDTLLKRGAAAVSLVAWLLALALGRWIAFV